MASPDTIQAVQLPDYDDPPAIPDDLRTVFYALMSRSVPRFSGEAARDAAYPSPVDGQLCMTGSGTTLRMWTAVGGEWLQFARMAGDLWSAEMPPSAQAASGSGAMPITQTGGFAPIPNANSPKLTIDLPAPARVRWTAGFWMAKVGTATDLRCGIGITGATVSAPQSPSWGAVAIHALATTGTIQSEVSKDVDMAAGESEARLEAYTSGGSCSVSYPKIGYQVLRWL